MTQLVPMNEPKVGIGPARPAIIAQRFECPSCNAATAEPCRLNGRFPQEYSHEARHQAARRSDWRAIMRELPISTGWEIGR